jgi:hypothetical protein
MQDIKGISQDIYEIKPTTTVIMNNNFTVYTSYDELKNIFVSEYGKLPDSDNDIVLKFNYIPVLYIGDKIHYNIQKNKTTKNSKIKLKDKLRITSCHKWVQFVEDDD